LSGKRVLLVIDADTRAPEVGRPVREYVVQRRLLDAHVVDRGDVAAHRLSSWVARRWGVPAGLTILAALRLPRCRAVYCDSEFYGIVLALLVRLTPLRTRIYFLAHHPTRPAKAWVLGRLGAHRGVAGIFVHASSLVDRLTAMGVPAAKVHLLPIAVDTTFWSPRGVQWSGPDYLSCAGVELRDYPTLVQAMRELPQVHARVAASSPYSRHGNSLDGLDLPPNLERVDCDTAGLRDVYEGSLFVVVPVVESEIGAGLTTIAEAMSMGKAVITSRAEGQSDTVADRRAQLRGQSGRATTGGVVKTFGMDVDDPDLAGPTGLYVTPGDAGQLRDAVSYLVAHPELAQDMGRRARRVAERMLAVERFGELTAAVVDGQANVSGTASTVR
jgi:glycosyltransferase involved in cell wall biosynthesis